MKILVPTKRVPDTDQRIRVRDDGQGIQDEALPYVINPFDAIALEESLRIRENGATEVEVVTVGIGSADYETELRAGLAMARIERSSCSATRCSIPGMSPVCYRPSSSESNPKSC